MKFSTKLFAVIILFFFSIEPVLPQQGESITQGLSPSTMVITQDGKYGYVGFDLSEVVFKVRLADLSIEAVADLSEYFPIESEDIALDAGEGKLFIYTPTWRKLIVLDTKTLGVIHSIDSINVFSMIRSRYGPYIITWGGGGTVTFVNTETYELTNFEYEGEFILKIQESNTDQDIWYVVSAKEPGNAELNAGIYNNKKKTWVRKVSLPTEARSSTVADLKVLLNEQKAYVAHFGGWSPEGFGYGWLHSIDLVSGEVKVVDIDGGAGCLEASPDNRWLYVGTGWPKLNTKNLLVVDTQSDNIVNQIFLGRTKFNWPYTQMNILQIDPANPELLYATSTDANAFIKMDLDSLKFLNALVFNQENYQPTSFIKRPGEATGFILIIHSQYAFELDLDKATIKGVVKFPNISQDVGIYDVAIKKDGRMFIPQGGSFLEVDGQNMQILGTYPLSPGTPWVWSFILSKEEKKIFSVTHNDQIANNFVAINTSNFQLDASLILEGGVFNFKPFELPDGSKLYALGGLPNGPVVIQVIETDTYTIKKTITYEEPGNLGISAGPYYPFTYDLNSHTLFVGATNVILAIDTDTDLIKKVIYLGDAARAVGFEPQNQFTYVNATGLVYNPQENFLYISHLDRSFLSIYDLNNDRFLPKLISVEGFFPKNMFASDNYSKIYSINFRSDNLSVMDVNSKAIEKIIDLHDYPLTSIIVDKEIPKEYSISQNYPNPFNPNTQLNYSVPKRSNITIKIYDALGREVTALINEEKSAGNYSVKFEGSYLSSGIYFYQIRSENFIQTKKMVLLK